MYGTESGRHCVCNVCTINRSSCWNCLVFHFCCFARAGIQCERLHFGDLALWDLSYRGLIPTYFPTRCTALWASIRWCRNCAQCDILPIADKSDKIGEDKQSIKGLPWPPLHPAPISFKADVSALCSVHWSWRIVRFVLTWARKG